MGPLNAMTLDSGCPGLMLYAATWLTRHCLAGASVQEPLCMAVRRGCSLLTGIFVLQNELSQSIQNLSEKAKVGTSFIQKIKSMIDKVEVRSGFVCTLRPAIQAVKIFTSWWPLSITCRDVPVW